MVGEGSFKAKEKPKVTKVAKTSDTASAPAPAQGKGSGPINIPLDEISPQLKKILVKEMIKGGKAKLIKKQGVKRVNERDFYIFYRIVL